MLRTHIPHPHDVIVKIGIPCHLDSSIATTHMFALCVFLVCCFGLVINSKNKGVPASVCTAWYDLGHSEPTAWLLLGRTMVRAVS